MSQNNQNQGRRGGQTISELANGKTKKRSLPDNFKYSIFFSLGWCVVACVCYSTGMFTHKGDTLDQFVSWSSGACGIFGLVFLAFAFTWLEGE